MSGQDLRASRRGTSQLSRHEAARWRTETEGVHDRGKVCKSLGHLQNGKNPRESETGKIGKHFGNLPRPFFTQISGRKFLPELCREAHPETAPFQALCCDPCSTEQSTFRRGEKGKMCLEKGRKRGGQQKGQKGKRTRECRSVPMILECLSASTSHNRNR